MVSSVAQAIDFERETVEVSTERLGKLRIFNLVMGALHFVSGALMVVLGNDFRLDISTFALNGPPGTPLEDGTINQVWGLPLAWATAAFLLLSAFFHFLIASPLAFGAYGRELRRGPEPLPLGRVLDLVHPDDRPHRPGDRHHRSGGLDRHRLRQRVDDPLRLVDGDGQPLRPQDLVDAVLVRLCGWDRPWAAIAAYIAFNVSQRAARDPRFVYGIIFTIFFFFNTFAINQWLQYRKMGGWSDYLRGETAYIS